MTLTIGLLVLGAVWLLAVVFVIGLCRAAGRRRPRRVVIPKVARRSAKHRLDRR